MATTRICVPNILPLEKDVIKVRIPSGTTLYQGSQVVAESLEGTSRSVYTGSLVADLIKDMPAILISQGVYEDANGARVEGYVNPGEMTYKANDVVTAIRPEKDLLFTISGDCFTGTAVKDQYLIPANGAEQLAVSATTGTAVVAYKIEQLINIPVGNTFVPGVLARIVLGR